MTGRRSIIFLIGACIVIGFVSQAQLSQENEISPLYEFRAAQVTEELGLAPSGSTNSDLEFGSVATAGLTVLKIQLSSPRTVIVKQTGTHCPYSRPHIWPPTPVDPRRLPSSYSGCYPQQAPKPSSQPGCLGGGIIAPTRICRAPGGPHPTSFCRS